MDIKKYRIVETHCFPNKWKIEEVGYNDDNATYRYHKTIEDAKTWIDKFGGTKYPTIEIIKLNF